jgi:protease II
LSRTAAIRNSLLSKAQNDLIVPQPTTKPEPIGDYFYYKRPKAQSETGEVFCRVPKLLLNTPKKEDEEILFDSTQNNDNYLTTCKVFGNNIVAVIDEEFSLSIRNLITGREIRSIQNAKEIEFLSASEVLLLLIDESKRPFKISLLNLITGEEEKVYKETSNEALYLDFVRSKNKQKIFFFETNRSGTQEISVLDVETRQISVLVDQTSSNLKEEYFCEQRGNEDTLIFSRDGKIYRNSLQEEVLEIPDISVDDVDIFDKALILYGSCTKTLKPEIIKLTYKQEEKREGYFETAHRIPFLYDSAKIQPQINSDYSARHVSFSVSSPAFPPKHLKLDLLTDKVAFSDEILTKDSKDSLQEVRTEIVFTTSDPAVPISLFIPSGKKTWKTRLTSSIFSKHEPVPTPMVLFSYGVYGEKFQPEYSLFTHLLLLHGVSVGYAHIRGGGERGSSWHVRGSQKEESVEDLKSCTDFLVSNNYTTRDKLILHSQSAGGTILAAALNKYGTSLSESGAVLRLPLLDLSGALNSQLGPQRTMPLQQLELDEWGNSPDFLCPLQNLSGETKYPAMFISACETDERVSFEGTNKYAEKMSQINSEFLFNQIKSGGTHETCFTLEEEVKELAFILDKLSINS